MEMGGARNKVGMTESTFHLLLLHHQSPFSSSTKTAKNVVAGTPSPLNIVATRGYAGDTSFFVFQNECSFFFSSSFPVWAALGRLPAVAAFSSTMGVATWGVADTFLPSIFQTRRDSSPPYFEITGPTTAPSIHALPSTAISTPSTGDATTTTHANRAYNRSPKTSKTEPTLVPLHQRAIARHCPISLLICCCCYYWMITLYYCNIGDRSGITEDLW